MKRQHGQPISLPGQTAVLAKVVLLAYVPAGILWLSLLFVSRRFGIPFNYFIKDPLGILKAPPYLGLLSNFGILMWTSAAALCLAASAVLAGNAPRREMSSCLFNAGLLSLLLALDDFFMLHERFVPIVLNGPECALPMAEGLYSVWWLLRYRRLILTTDYLLLFAAFGFFALSLAVDAVHGNVPHRNLLEDGSKLFGILTWLIYFSRLCLQELRAGSKT